ncbi:purine-binding chemotaxis protein CheW [Alkalispirochaeta americana]|uniref:Purine-binding chemotaxis protein CheW n=1 Tax=Alkalispirochaeta americana TaxID=159291 RepID=A0A1N6QG12_9SPIO|nr:chemotaxis protein CheW [Alkalispirochaeta americana]SIQ15452.1 purine-binding chemotaxis protein CheW [Alkalispirochaeta americana]
MSDDVHRDERNEYLTFTLADEQYAVGVYDVKEVLEYTTVTRVPRTQDFMRGVINLRGSVVPVIDLRLKFGMEATERTIDTSIVVLEVELGGSVVTVGALADSVQEVISLEPENIEPPPRIGTRINTDFIRGIGKQDEKFIIILDINRVFSEEELAAVAEEAEAR